MLSPLRRQVRAPLGRRTGPGPPRGQGAESRPQGCFPNLLALPCLLSPRDAPTGEWGMASRASAPLSAVLLLPVPRRPGGGSPFSAAGPRPLGAAGAGPAWSPPCAPRGPHQQPCRHLRPPCHPAASGVGSKADCHSPQDEIRRMFFFPEKKRKQTSNKLFQLSQPLAESSLAAPPSVGGEERPVWCVSAARPSMRGKVKQDRAALTAHRSLVAGKWPASSSGVLGPHWLL